MALTIYQPIEPDGNFPAVKAKDVEMPDGTRLGELDLGSMNVVSYDLVAMGVPNLVVDGNPLQLETDTTEIANAMATSIVTVNLNVEYSGLVFPVKAVFVPNGNVATVNLLTTVAFISVFVTEGKIMIGAEIAKHKLTGAGHAVQDTPPEDTSVLWVDPTDNSDDGFQEAVNIAVSKANGGLNVSGATVGQTVIISAVDEKGAPTAWEPVDFPSGGGGDEVWEEIASVTTTEDLAGLTITEDTKGQPFTLKKASVFARIRGTNSATTGWINLDISDGQSTLTNKSYPSGFKVTEGQDYYYSTKAEFEIREIESFATTYISINSSTAKNDLSVGKGQASSTVQKTTPLKWISSFSFRCIGASLGANTEIYIYGVRV